jgi:hypothetical protein
MSIVTVLAFVALVSAANASFPGANGKIAFTSLTSQYQVYTVDPDGSNLTLTSLTDSPRSPRWSPGGTKIAYIHGYGYPRVSNADGTQTTGLNAQGDQVSNLAWSPTATELVQLERYVNACPDPDFCDPPDPPFLSRPGYPSGYTRLPGNDGDYPDWSPDGSRIAFSHAGAVQTETPDGGAVATIASGSDPSWSPDGSKIAFTQGTFDQADIMIANADGSGLTRISLPDGQLAPAWSPDGTKIAFEWVVHDPSTGSTRYDIAVMNADGSDATRIVSDGTSFEPDWQPIPINAYPRPRGASPMRISLVPAYPPCTSPDHTHGAPLAFPSCANPQLASQYLTVGTPDANGKRTTMEASILLRVVSGASADVRIDSDINNVFKKDLSDYTGGLRARLPLQITDRDNTPSPGGPGAATVEPLPFEFDLACTPTADSTVGSDCAVSTTANALVPGAITAGLRAIWQLGQAQVYDGGPDGNPVSADNTLFMDQGLFVP